VEPSGSPLGYVTEAGGGGEVMGVPRTSRYVIELSADERDQLERRARVYAAEGMADIEIAARLDCHPDSVSSRRRRFCAEPKAGRVVDLYARRFKGRLLHPGEYVICADEKSQLQALARRHATVPAAPGRPALVEFEYRRGSTLAYLAAWDVHHARIFGRCEPKTGIERSDGSSIR
jgi:DNA-binding CsgD family transcriptional regulator